MCLNIGTPITHKFSIWNKWKIYGFRCSNTLWYVSHHLVVHTIIGVIVQKSIDDIDIAVAFIILNNLILCKSVYFKL